MNKQSRLQQRLQEAMDAASDLLEVLATDQRRISLKRTSPWPLSNYFLHLEKNRTPTKESFIESRFNKVV